VTTASPAFNPREPSPAAKLALGLYVGGALLIATLAFSSSLTFSSVHLSVASLLLFISIHAYLSWFEKRETQIPAWPLLCIIHFIYFGLPVFGAPRTSPSSYDHQLSFSDSQIADAMLVGLVGLLAIASGRKIT